MIPTYKQIGYISHTLKANRNMYPELKEMFPPKVKDGADISLAELEIKVSRLERATLSDVISLLMDDKIVEGYRQLDYLIKEH